jgi:P4 family phage/plasmid primase-like protien
MSTTSSGEDGAPEDVRARFQITVVRNNGGPLCKRVELGADGELIKHAAANMWHGTARRAFMPENGPKGAPEQFAKLISSLDQHEALAPATITSTDQDNLRVVLDGREDVEFGHIARTKKHFGYQEGVAAWFLLDYDRGGMPEDVAKQLAELGGFGSAIIHVAPALASMAFVWRPSTTAGIIRIADGHEFPSGGEHLYAIAADGSEIADIIKALHRRLWLAGLGWFNLSAIGSLLERSPVDTSTGSPERLAFEAAPILDNGLTQDAERRRPDWRDGSMVTLADVALTDAEAAHAKELIEAKKREIMPQSERKRRAWAKDRVEEMVNEGAQPEAARRAVEAIAENRTLMPSFVLDFHGRKVRVRDVLLAPAEFDGHSLYDPIEGASYGSGKACVFYNKDTGSIIVHSFAHGGFNYFLRYDLKTILEVLTNLKLKPTEHHNAGNIALGLMERAELEPHEESAILKFAAPIAKCSVGSLTKSWQQRVRERDKARAEGDGEATGTFDPSTMAAASALRTTFENGAHLVRADKQFWRFVGTHWVRVTDEQVGNLLLPDVARIAEPGKNHGVLKGALDFLRAMASTPDDPDPMRLLAPALSVINCQNGELWIDDGGSAVLVKHDPKSRLRHCLNISYDPAATAPRYDQAIREIFSRAADPEAMVRYFEELAGYCLQPRRFIKAIFILEGGGDDGKSSLLSLITQLLGDAVLTTRVDRMDEDTFATGDLINKLVLIDDDVRKGTVLPDGLLKQISEEKPMYGNVKFGARQRFICRALPVMATNNPIGTRDLSPGLRDRLHLIPMTRRFEEHERDRTLWASIRATEMPGVLNRFLAGLQRVLARGSFDEPVECVKAKRKWLGSANTLVAFLEAATERGDDYLAPRSRLWAHYTHWCEDQGIAIGHRLQKRHFFEQLQQLGFGLFKHNGDYVFRSLRIRPQVEMMRGAAEKIDPEVYATWQDDDVPIMENCPGNAPGGARPNSMAF